MQLTRYFYSLENSIVTFNEQRIVSASTLCKFHDNNYKLYEYIGYLYLIVPFWHASVAYQTSLVEQSPASTYLGQTWSSQNTHGETNRALKSRRSLPKSARLDIYRTQIRPSDHDIVVLPLKPYHFLPGFISQGYP